MVIMIDGNARLQQKTFVLYDVHHIAIILFLALALERAREQHRTTIHHSTESANAGTLKKNLFHDSVAQKVLSDIGYSLKSNENIFYQRIAIILHYITLQI